MNRQRKVLITTTYNELGIIIDTKAEEVAQPDLQPTCNQLATDCISRQQAIDALDKHIDTFDAIDTNYLCGLRTAMSILKEMPSAQPETHDKRTETHACDLISRQAAIDIVDIAKDLCPDTFGKSALKAVRDKLSELPTENTKRKKGKWEKGYFYGNVYRCSVCHEPIEIPYTYCPSCGAFMSPYIGKLQRGEHDG